MDAGSPGVFTWQGRAIPDLGVPIYLHLFLIFLSWTPRCLPPLGLLDLSFYRPGYRQMFRPMFESSP